MKYLLPTFSNLPAIDLGRYAKGLLVRLHTITGWKLPDDDFFLNTLVAEFTKYLTENCGDLNPEEIGYAFRNYGLEIKDWGKSMNLQLIHDPISEYRKIRADISNMEERLREAKKPEKPVETTGEVDWSEDWEKIKQMAREGEINGLFITDALYGWMDKQGLITMTPKEKWQMVYEAAIIHRMELQHDHPIPNKDVKAKLWKLDDGTWKEDHDLHSAVWLRAKKECVKLEAFKAIKNEHQGYQN
jgi:hypothetical protein